ncbi:MAG: glycosyltransferase [Gemmataceae bacterium]
MQALNHPVRVCFLIDELATAGTETQLLALIRHLDRSRVTPYLVLLRGEQPASRALEPDSCPVLRLGVGSLRHPATVFRAWRFVQFLWRERIDVVQAYFPDSSYFGVPVSWLAGVRYRIRTRNNIGHWMTPLHRRLGRALNRLTTRTIANCAAARDALVRDEQTPNERVVVMENGVDLDRFLAIPPLRETGSTVGAVANLRPVKGLDVLVEAARMLRDSHPQATFQVAGEGEARPALEQQIQAADLGGRFRLPGAQRDVPGFLGQLDVAVLSSRAEGMSNAVLEYMAAGRPIVATATGATPDLLRDGVDGLLVPPGDAAALAGAIGRLLTDRDLARRLGDSARARVAARFSRAAMVQRFEQFYLDLVGETTR